MTSFETLTAFLEAWQDKNYTKMFEYCQLTWKSNHKEGGIKWLKNYYDHKKLTTWRMIKEEKADFVVDFKVAIIYDHKSKIVKTRLICEKAPYKPHSDGTWGVNPISVLREIKQ